MTDEVLAAIEGARQAGATGFVVSDSHGNGESLLIEKFGKDVQIVRAWPRPLAMMQGIDESFSAAMFIGYHAGTTNPTGVRAHTMSSALLADARVNGVSFPEAGLNAAVAGAFRVPVVLLTGDDAIGKEAAALFPGIEVATVKWANGFHSARTLTPAASCDLIRAKAKAALSRAGNDPAVSREAARRDRAGGSRTTGRRSFSRTCRSSSASMLTRSASTRKTCSKRRGTWSSSSTTSRASRRKHMDSPPARRERGWRATCTRHRQEERSAKRLGRVGRPAREVSGRARSRRPRRGLRRHRHEPALHAARMLPRASTGSTRPRRNILGVLSLIFWSLVHRR